MRSLPRRDRILVIVWIVLAVVLWNAIFEMLIVQGVKQYLFRAAMHDAGRAPFVAIADVMNAAIYRATWVATMWTSIVLLAGMLTMRCRGELSKLPKSPFD
jgi:hypothetical protein